MSEALESGESVAHRGNHLLRILGIAFGLAAVVGSAVGQGILRSPGVVASASPVPAVIIGLWVLGGMITLISAFAFAELGAAIPEAGGTYVFVARAFGPAAGAFSGFGILIAQATSLALMCYIVGEYLVRLGIGGGNLEPAWLGLMVFALLCLMNAMGTRIAGMSQVVLSTLKVGILLGLITALFAHPGAASPQIPVETTSTWPAFATALMLVMNTYAGWQSLTYYGEEIKDPGRTIPRSLFCGILGIMALYLLINVAMLHVLTPAQMASSIFPAADAAGVVFGERGDVFLTAFGILSVSAIANLFVMSSSRMTFALARRGNLPRMLSNVAANGTPRMAIVFIAVIATSFILTGSYVPLATTTTALTQFNFVAALASLFALRKKEPDLERPFRAPLYPWFPVLALAVGLAVLAVFMFRDPWNAMVGFVLVAGLSMIDHLAKTWRKKPIPSPIR